MFPLVPKGKAPLTPRWFNDFPTDPKVIAGWWRCWPRANVGIATGGASGIGVLDVDPQDGGDTSLDVLIEHYGPLPDTSTVVIGGGGAHHYFAIRRPTGSWSATTSS